MIISHLLYSMFMLFVKGKTNVNIDPLDTLVINSLIKHCLSFLMCFYLTVESENFNKKCCDYYYNKRE